MARVHETPGERPEELLALTVADPDLNFEAAKRMAKDKVREIGAEAMMLSWFDGSAGRGFPDYDCGTGGRPPWRVFAESRGGNLTIDINDGRFIFIFLTL
jgi:Domain of unknown function (DUF5619)